MVYLLLLEIVLSAALGLASGKRTLVVALTSVDADMARQMTTGGESLCAGGAYVWALFLDLWRVRRGWRGVGVRGGGA